ncbi:hypothetical protein FB45DRAFT_210142 [Roridomyces roridus]|uniref:Uncharacterized protein n=1 Tax=Roridomyces roridus TaxID=1738132 RepID=A0AAD7CGJ5_9AGAR|nr:hypothetical protein FB45DRAFT_210142 [Roridomyces roridus]
MSISTHTGSSESPPGYRSGVPSSMRSQSLADSVRTASSAPSYRSAPLPPLFSPTTALISGTTHTGACPPSYRSGVPSSVSSESLADSASTVSSVASYRSPPLTPLSPPPPPSLVTAPDYEVHYRIYTPTGAIPVKAAASSPDPFVGRILARSVPPPHLAGMLKRRILAAEGLPDRTISVEESPKAQLVAPSNLLETFLFLYPSITSISSSPPATTTSGTQIYATMYDSQPMKDDAAVVLTGDGRHGASPDNPLAVVLLEELSIEATNARPQAEEYANREIPLDKYVYYRLYNRDGEVRSSAAFDSVHTAQGRIERAHIIPPATVNSLKLCVSKVEHRRIWFYADLYEGTAPRDALWGGTSIGREMGGDVNSPLMMVQPERKSGLFNRPARMLKTRRFRQSDSNICDVQEGTMIQTDGLLVGDFWCECEVPGLTEKAMLKRKWFELLDE